MTLLYVELNSKKAYFKRDQPGWRHFVDNDISWTLFFNMGDFSWTLSKGDFSWTLLATSRGRKCPRNIIFFGDFSWTFFG